MKSSRRVGPFHSLSAGLGSWASCPCAAGVDCWIDGSKIDEGGMINVSSRAPAPQPISRTYLWDQLGMRTVIRTHPSSIRTDRTSSRRSTSSTQARRCIHKLDMTSVSVIAHSDCTGKGGMTRPVIDSYGSPR